MGVVTNWTVPSALLGLAFPCWQHTEESFGSVLEQLDDVAGLFTHTVAPYFPLSYSWFHILSEHPSTDGCYGHMMQELGHSLSFSPDFF